MDSTSSILMDTAMAYIDNRQMEGLSVLITGAGTIEVQSSLQAGLLELGCEVYFNRYGRLEKEIFDHPINIVFHLSILAHGFRYINKLRTLLDIRSPNAIIIDLSLAHPIISTLGLGLNSIDDINTFLKDRRIIQWSMCETTLEEWNQYGLCNGIYAPLGLGKHVFLTKNSKEAVDNWFNKKSELMRVESSTMTNSYQKSKQHLMEQKIVYAGLPTSPWEKFIYKGSSGQIKFLTEKFLPNSKKVFRKLSNIKIEPGNIQGFIEYHHQWALKVPLERRRKMVKFLSKHFRDHISIWGDGWDQYINNSHKTSMLPRWFYNKALCCLDFGSLMFDTSLFPRTCEIIKGGGLLVSGIGDTTTELISENQFETSDELLHIVEDIFDPIKRQTKMEKQMSLHSKYNFEKILSNVVKQAYEVV